VIYRDYARGCVAIATGNVVVVVVAVVRRPGTVVQKGQLMFGPKATSCPKRDTNAPNLAGIVRKYYYYRPCDDQYKSQDESTVLNVFAYLRCCSQMTQVLK